MQPSPISSSHGSEPTNGFTMDSPQAKVETGVPIAHDNPILPPVAEIPAVTTSTPNTSPALDLQPAEPGQPVPVVRVLSTRGVEYGMMTIALWVAATTMAWVVLNMLNGSRGFDTVVVPTSSLVICLPIFGWLFLRLKKTELTNPGLRLDPSKRRWSQTTQFLAYIVLLINFIYFVYTILQHASGGKAPSISKSAVNLVVVLVIAGGILFYYWHDEHRARKS